MATSPSEFLRQCSTISDDYTVIDAPDWLASVDLPDEGFRTMLTGTVDAMRAYHGTDTELALEALAATAFTMGVEWGRRYAPERGPNGSV